MLLRLQLERNPDVPAHLRVPLLCKYRRFRQAERILAPASFTTFRIVLFGGTIKVMPLLFITTSIAWFILASSSNRLGAKRSTRSVSIGKEAQGVSTADINRSGPQQ